MSTCWGIAALMASICRHPLPHPERLVGSRTGQSAIFPPELATKYVEGAIAEKQNTGRLSSEEATASMRMYADTVDAADDPHNVLFAGPFADWVHAGRAKLEQLRHGRAAVAERASHAETIPAERTHSRPSSTMSSTSSPGPSSLPLSSIRTFERAQLGRLQRADEEFSDIFAAFLALRAVEEKEEDATTN